MWVAAVYDDHVGLDQPLDLGVWLLRTCFATRGSPGTRGRSITQADPGRSMTDKAPGSRGVPAQTCTGATAIGRGAGTRVQSSGGRGCRARLIRGRGSLPGRRVRSVHARDLRVATAAALQ